MDATKEVELFARLARNEPRLAEWLQDERDRIVAALAVQVAPGVHVSQGKYQTLDRILKLLREAPAHA